jgi:hypothetical protein
VDGNRLSLDTSEAGRREENFTMKFIQINLHHSKAATAVVCQKLALGKADIALIQEPWIQEGCIG